MTTSGNDDRTHGTLGTDAAPESADDTLETKSPVQHELEPAPAEVSELAQACIEFVARALKFTLDFSPETIPVLDHYVQGVRVEAAGKPEVVRLLAPAIGAYFGEVVRRNIPLRWFSPKGEHQRWRLEFEQVFLSFNPIGAAMEAVVVQDIDGWGGAFRLRGEDEPLAKSAVRNLPDVSPEEFYLPSTRYEVLTFVVDALTARELAEAGEEADLGAIANYTADDYGPVRAEAIGVLLADEDAAALN